MRKKHNDILSKPSEVRNATLQNIEVINNEMNGTLYYIATYKTEDNELKTLEVSDLKYIDNKMIVFDNQLFNIEAEIIATNN